MQNAIYNDVLSLLRQHDIEGNVTAIDGSDFQQLVDALDHYFDPREVRRAVLGIDIYQYSGYDGRRQRLIPVIFKYLHDMAMHDVLRLEPRLFRNELLQNNFIPTGDGGFQVLSTPLHALLLCIWFQVALNGFNTGLHFPRLRRFIGPLTLRYALTFGTLVRFNDNSYGPAIINNARIMSRDTLNRFLLDDAAVNWFLDRIGGIENLLVLRNEDLAQIPELALATAEVPNATHAFRDRTQDELDSGTSGFRTVILQKIGSISAKKSTLDVYSCYFQVASVWTDSSGQFKRRYLITVGNLNASGIAN